MIPHCLAFISRGLILVKFHSADDKFTIPALKVGTCVSVENAAFPIYSQSDPPRSRCGCRTLVLTLEIDPRLNFLITEVLVRQRLLTTSFSDLHACQHRDQHISYVNHVRPPPAAQSCRLLLKRPLWHEWNLTKPITDHSVSADDIACGASVFLKL